MIHLNESKYSDDIHTLYLYLSGASDTFKSIFILSTCFRWCKERVKLDTAFNLLVYIYTAIIMTFSLVLAILICKDLYNFSDLNVFNLMIMTLFVVYVFIKLSFHVIYIIQLLTTSLPEKMDETYPLPYITINNPQFQS